MEKLEFYAIEGLDGVGKTTLIQNLENQGLATYKTPNKIFSIIRKELHNLNKSSLFFYLSSLAFLFEKEIKNNNLFFVDRYLFSTIGNFAYKNNLLDEEINELFYIFYKFFPVPKLTIFLVLDYNERIKRINIRNQNENNLDNLKKSYNDYIMRMIHNYKYSPKIIIDANKKEKEIITEVLGKINL
jgi:thymidylate kinase